MKEATHRLRKEKERRPVNISVSESGRPMLTERKRGLGPGEASRYRRSGLRAQLWLFPVSHNTETKRSILHELSKNSLFSEVSLQLKCSLTKLSNVQN